MTSEGFETTSDTFKMTSETFEATSEGFEVTSEGFKATSDTSEATSEEFKVTSETSKTMLKVSETTYLLHKIYLKLSSSISWAVILVTASSQQSQSSITSAILPMLEPSSRSRWAAATSARGKVRFR